MAFLTLLLIDLACIASGTYLVITEHYGWAWIPFVVVLTLQVKHTKKNKE